MTKNDYSNKGPHFRKHVNFSEDTLNTYSILFKI